MAVGLSTASLRLCCRAVEAHHLRTLRNRRAVEAGDRILSAYAIDPEKPCAGFGDNCLWIITEADRSVTTILLPDEY